MPSLKYISTAVAFQEVPDEVSMVFNIGGCTHHCDGCHSPYLAEDVGTPLLSNLSRDLDRYRQMITCVCFMGGDQNVPELSQALELCRERGLRTCLYTGLDSPVSLADAVDKLDYLKIGHYDKERGGLDSPNTNQRMYRRDETGWTDITARFQKGGVQT